MLYHALDICILAKLCSTTLKIPDDGRAESLGIPRIVDPAGWRHYGRRPTPVMLDAQIATIWMGIMGKARKRLLSELKKKILGRKRENWYIIYLTTFIILWNLEYIYEHQKERVDLFSKKVILSCNVFGTSFERLTCFQHPRQSFPHLCFAMMDQWRVAAENILAHFHTISQGNIPFSINWDENEAQRIANVDAKAVEYLNKVRAILDERGICLPPHAPFFFLFSLLCDPPKLEQEITCAKPPKSLLERHWCGFRHCSSPIQLPEGTSTMIPALVCIAKDNIFLDEIIVPDISQSIRHLLYTC